GTHVVYNGKLSEEHCINSTSKTYDGDQWVTAELIVLGDSLIKHVINGDTVLQYSKPQIGGPVVNGYDPAEKIDGKLLNRSEEHTSELQSRENLVCRLLLEKKKTKKEK